MYIIETAYIHTMSVLHSTETSQWKYFSCFPTNQTGNQAWLGICGHYYEMKHWKSLGVIVWGGESTTAQLGAMAFRTWELQFY